MFSSCNPKLFAVRNIHYSLNTFSYHFDTDAVVPSSDHCRTQAVLPPRGHFCIETVAPSGDQYGIDLHCCSSAIILVIIAALREYRHLVIITATITHSFVSSKFKILTLSRRGLQICNTKFNYLQLIRFSFKITSKQFLYLRGPMLPLYTI